MPVFLYCQQNDSKNNTGSIGLASPSTANYSGSSYTPQSAKELVAQYKAAKQARPVFTCPQCHGPVKPHLGRTAPHFEHLERNKDCKLSTPLKRTGGRKATVSARVGLDEVAALEGYKRDAREQASNARDGDLAQKRKKQDNYRCQACGWRLLHNRRYVIDCHHRHPVAYGVRETTLADLVSLCPTCHRIAHLFEQPLDVDEIKEVRRAATVTGVP